MRSKISIAGHDVSIALTRAAEKALVQMQDRVIAEMELYFSCLIRKKVRFYQGNYAGEVVYIDNKLGVCFRPIMTKVCSKDYEGTEPPTTDFPIHHAEKFIPKWLKIDYRHGEWMGDFGFTH